MKIDRTKKPPPSGDIEFHLPGKETFYLSNGLKVVFVKNEKLPIVQLSFAINAGSRFDEAGKKGKANLLAGLIDEGAGDYDSLQLNNEFELLGSHFNISVNSDALFLSVLTLSEHLKKSCELIGLILSDSHLAEKDFFREQKSIITRIMQMKDEPDEIADLWYEKIIFGKENPYAYPVIGLETDVPLITLDEIKRNYRKYVIPNNSVLVVVGNIEKEKLHDFLETTLCNWKEGTPAIFNPSQKENGKPAIYVVHKDDAAQSEIRTGHVSVERLSPDYFPAMLMNMILGGQFSSRINLNLREEKGFTYGASSNFYYNLINSYFKVSASVGTENTVAAINEIFKEIKLIRKEISQDELTFAQSSLIKKFPSQFETYKQVAANLLNQELYSLPLDYFDTYINNIASVRLEDVISAAQNRIHPELLVSVIAGDREKILPQLQSINSYEIIEIENEKVKE